MRKKVLAEYNMGGIKFFIPCYADEFTADMQRVNNTPEQEINEAIEDINAFAEEIENGNDEAERFHDYMRNGEESLLREQEHNFPL